MKNFNKILTGVIASVLISSGTIANAMPVDVELALVIDASGSISNADFELQMAGYEAAFNNATVGANIDGLVAAGGGGVAVKLFFFAKNAVASIDALLTSAAEAATFADAIGSLGRPSSIGISTNIVAGMQLAYNWLTGNDFEGKLIEDVSGDGVQNVDIAGFTKVGAVQNKRNQATAAGIEVNGLAIDSTGFNGACLAGGYYTNNVVNNACYQATSFGNFEEAVVAKIIFETGGGTVPEPGLLALLGLGLVGLSLRKRKLAYA